MKIVTYCESKSDIKKIKKMGASEVLLGHSTLSRLGKLESTDFNELLDLCWEENLRPVLEWDILMTEKNLTQAAPVFSQIAMEKIAAIRVQDPGSFEYVLQHYPELKIQLILETGNHNEVGIKRWLHYGKDQIERLIVSYEIPQQELALLIKDIQVPVEMLGLGRILLFYTPRSLVSWQYEAKRKESEFIEASGTSEESPHRGFPLIENKHGTFMFHIKELCLLEYLEQLKNIGITHLRIDSRSPHVLSFSEEVASLMENFSLDAFKEFKNSYPAKLTRGFFPVNKTDVLFPKLKNQQIKRHDKNYIGYVLEVKKPHYTAVWLKKPKAPLKNSDQLKVMTPSGKELKVQVKFLKNSRGIELDQVQGEQVIFMNIIKGADVKSALYFAD